MSVPSRRVLCPLAPGFEEIEALAPVDLLRRAGAEVVVAALLDETWVTGRSGVAVRADTVLANASERGFDALVIPGGPGTKAIRADGRVRDLARAFAAAGKPIAAICAAPTVLRDAGLLEGKRFTAHHSVYDELPNAIAEERVVEDGLLITSRGAGTAVDFGLAIVRRLYGKDVCDEVARAIMA